jgi:hypothetical protein
MSLSATLHPGRPQYDLNHEWGRIFAKLSQSASGWLQVIDRGRLHDYPGQ